jgi:recombination protein RecA
MHIEHSEERKGALQNTVQNLEKRFGRGVLMRMGEQNATSVPVIPTGILSLDIALGTGGWPKGRIIEIYGPESSGKTSVTLQAIAKVQAEGGVAAFVDAEHALEPSYARALGVHTDALLVSQPDSGEQALEIVEALVRSGAVDLVVVDSVAALVPQAEIEGEMGDAHVGLQARLMSQALRKLTGAVSRTGCIVIFINQVRQKIGVTFGPSETTTGGNALKFYASIRIDIRRLAQVKGRDEIVGNRTRIKIVKNKLAPPFRTVETEIRFGAGICPIGDLIALAEANDVFQKSGSWFSFADERLGNGRDAVRQKLLEDKALVARVEAAIRACVAASGPRLPGGSAEVAEA